MITPFDAVYEQLIAQIMADNLLKEVRSKNIIRYDNDSDPGKGARATADFPEIVVYMFSISGNLHASSSHAMLTTRWRIQVNSGSWKVDEVHALLWASIRVLTRWKRQHGNTVKWKNHSIVRDVRLSNADQGLTSQNTTNVSGWASLIDAEIDLSFPLTDMIEND